MCPTGYGTEKNGSISCLPCNAGQYSSKLGTECINCPKGQFRPSDDSNPTRCLRDPGQTTLDEGGAAVCTPCELGKYGDSSKSQVLLCIKCPQGKYQDVRGQTTCLECPIGKIANNKSTACARPDYVIASDCKPKLECLDDRDNDVYKHVCMPCPVCGICDIPVALSELEPMPGFHAYSWAPSNKPFANVLFRRHAP